MDSKERNLLLAKKIKMQFFGGFNVDGSDIV